MSSKYGMRTRKSEVSEMITATPNKRRSTRIQAINSASVKTTAARKTSVRTRGAPIRNRCDSPSSSSSSSSSDDDEEDVVKEKDLPSSDDEQMDVDVHSDELGDDLDLDEVPSSAEKENRRRTRSQASGRLQFEDSPSKKVARDLKSMCNVVTPSKKKTGKSPAKGKENTTPRKNLQKSVLRSRKVFVEDSDDEFSDELGDAEVTRHIRKIQEQKVRTPLQPIRIPVAMLKPKVTPLVIHKTPGGSLRTRQRIRRNSDEEPLEPILPSGSTPNSLRELARCLHLSKVPEKLPCREYESREIEKFIREVIDPKRGESAAMYISGVPGTGKTATLRAVVNAMQKNKKTPKFVYVEVNAMIFKKTVFSEIYMGIQQEHNISKKSTTKISGSAARQQLNSIFRKEDRNRPPIVILIDELDSLCNRKQDVLYDIFEWTALPQSKVTIIGIANTLDFPERMLCQRNASRLDKRRLVFQPYQHEQIQEIVRARLQGSKLVEPNAVELVAKKVAMNTGDLRQALDFLCRAIQVAVEQKAERLELRHVVAAQHAVLEPFKYRLVKGLRLHPFTMFRTIESLTREQEEVRFANIYKTYCRMCTEVSGIQPVSDSFAYGILLQLSTTSLIKLSKGDHGMMNRTARLGMSTMEAEKAVKQYVEANRTFYSL